MAAPKSEGKRPVYDQRLLTSGSSSVWIQGEPLLGAPRSLQLCAHNLVASQLRCPCPSPDTHAPTHVRRFPSLGRPRSGGPRRSHLCSWPSGGLLAIHAVTSPATVLGSAPVPPPAGFLPCSEPHPPRGSARSEDRLLPTSLTTVHSSQKQLCCVMLPSLYVQLKVNLSRPFMSDACC